MGFGVKGFRFRVECLGVGAYHEGRDARGAEGVDDQGQGLGFRVQGTGSGVWGWKEDISLPGKGDPHSHGVRPVY